LDCLPPRAHGSGEGVGDDGAEPASVLIVQELGLPQAVQALGISVIDAMLSASV
jgi:hypothetical protein